MWLIDVRRVCFSLFFLELGDCCGEEIEKIVEYESSK